MTSGAAAAQAELRRSIEQVTARLERAAGRAGRDPARIVLIAVTKTVPATRISAAIEAGITNLGENRVQEAAAKIPEIAGMSAGVTWHLIGHLQSNKVGKAAELFHCVHSVDSPELARRLDVQAGQRGRHLDVLLQVDLGHEPTKHGADEGRLADLAAEVAGLPRLRLRGLMTIPPLFDDPESSRPYFRRLRLLRDTVAVQGLDLPELSMGMTNDFEVAVEEGSTMVRVGRALFGERPPAG